MKKITSAFVLISIIVLSTISCKKKGDEPTIAADTMNYDMDEAALINAGWTKTMDEQFNGDFSNWTIWKGGAYNNEYQYYSDASKNVFIQNGVLTIAAFKETVTGNSTNSSTTQKSFDFTSGRLESKSTISANSTTPKVRFSARLKLAAGYGMWPAFWSYGATWPTNGEIDVIESKGHLPFQYGTNYFYGSTAGVNQVPSNSGLDYTTTKDLTLYWHVYEVIWEETKLTYMLNGKVIRTLTSDTAPGQYIDDMFGKTQNITLNLAVGGDYFGNPAPSTIVTGKMQVDWVKVFTSN